MKFCATLKVIVFFLWAQVALAVQFVNISKNDSLSSDWVYCITQDHQGFMWFGTNSGLDRWDGIEVRSFKHDPSDANSLSSNDIKRIHQDSDGIFWIGTTKGLDRFDPVTETFTRHCFEENNDRESWVIHIVPEGDSLLWLGTLNGLVRFQKETGQFEKFFYQDEGGDIVDQYRGIWSLMWLDEEWLIAGTEHYFFKFHSKTHQCAPVHPVFKERAWGIGYACYKDSEGLLWLCCSSGGVFCLDHKSGTLQRYINNEDTTYINYPCVVGILEDRLGDIWFASLGGGLNHYCKKTKKFSWFTPEMGVQGKISTSITIGFCEDRQGNIWCGSYDGGVNMIPRWGKNIRVHGKYYDEKKSIGDGLITDICQDADGYVWVASAGGGMAKISPDFSKAEHMRYTGQQPFENPWFLAIEKDHKNNLWFGSYSVAYMDRNTLAAEWLKTPEMKLPGIIPDHTGIVSMCEDSVGNMWFGSALHGLICLTPNRHFKYYHHNLVDTTTLAGNNIYSLMCDSNGHVWIGTVNGLSCMAPGEDIFHNYSLCRKDSNKIISNYIAFTTFEDSHGCLWLGTDNGLYCHDKSNDNFIDRTTDLGIRHQDITAILEDQKGRLWIESATHLYQFDSTNRKVMKYGTEDGFVDIGAGLGYNRDFFLGRDGYIYYGGNKKVARFHPDSVFTNPDPPPIVFTNLEVDYQQLESGENDILTKALNYAEKITLPFSINSFSVEFAALDYTQPKRNQYTYKLDGFHKNWIQSQTNRKALFPRLSPGQYTLRVRACNNDGVWNEEGAFLKIHILPPWWRTNWAYFLWTSLLGAIVYSLYRWQLKRARFREKMALEREHMQKLQELDSLKSNFMANISHELRTPLTLIMGPLDNILKRNTNDYIDNQLQMMRRNGRRLLQLINQLLDFAKVEAGTMKLAAVQMDIITFIKRIVASFMSAAERKNISLEFKADDRVLLCYVDSDKLEKVLANILSNAFKFTPQGGRIVVHIHREVKDNKDHARIAICDTGIGIDQQEIGHIFDRFYQIDGSQTRKQEGAGIGLALAKEMIELHGGSIDVRSQIDHGSQFIIWLPLGRAHLDDKDIVSGAIDESIFAPHEIVAEPIEVEQKKISRLIKPLVLVVEDNGDVRSYLHDLLSPEYKVCEAQNGVAGFELAVDKMPDLIISDIMMPEMDGYELCEKIKTDECTSHIPVILLTARAGEKDKLSGLETGADDYIVKPFSEYELLARVKNLIAQRKKLREKFSRTLDIDPRQITVTSIDRQFLNHAIDTVKEYMADPSFSIDFLARQVGLSRMHLHRKLKALTNLNATQFVLVVRLKCAAQLLEENAGTVTEIAYQVGFQNPSYFSTCFRKQFGLSPSEINSSKF
ncbi:response regulator [candidate division KSB1 bacterium]|nr:response regulator [candidate division KSB1 bacterium]